MSHTLNPLGTSQDILKEGVMPEKNTDDPNEGSRKHRGRVGQGRRQREQHLFLICKNQDQPANAVTTKPPVINTNIFCEFAVTSGNKL